MNDLELKEDYYKQINVNLKFRNLTISELVIVNRIISLIIKS